MQTVDKVMRLLGEFSPALPEIGLSELARRAGYDKAATRRFLVALGQHGLIEQNPETRKYRLGPGFLRFARVREATLPLAALVRPALEALARGTGETAHASLLLGDRLVTLAVAEPARATRVFVDPTVPLPLHATASGLACLAFMPPASAEALIGAGPLPAFTASTPSGASLRALIETARRSGFARAERSFEEEVVGTAAPLFDWAGRPLGAVAVAAVASRFTAEAGQAIAAAVMATAVALTRATGGEPHPALLAAAAA
jgi:DNA-binding IclR family transcriptional regulator